MNLTREKLNPGETSIYESANHLYDETTIQPNNQLYETPSVYNLENKSMNSLKPILYNQLQQAGNDTIMVDDIMSIYSTVHKNKKTINSRLPNKSAADQNVIDSSINVIINSNPPKHLLNSDEMSSKRNKTVNYPDQMHQEMCSEDIYTLRFNANTPIEPFDDSVPKEQQSYMYNGNLNRPAFEIISHADLRSATPVKFEQTNELLVNSNRKSSNSKKWLKVNDDQDDIDDDIDIEDDEIIRTTERHKKTSVYTRNNNKSNTKPLNLKYGNEFSVKKTGEPVEWQMANELRTTNWDYLRGYADSLNAYNIVQSDTVEEIEEHKRFKEKAKRKSPSYDDIKHSTLSKNNNNTNNSYNFPHTYNNDYLISNLNESSKINDIYNDSNLLDNSNNSISRNNSLNKSNLYTYKVNYQKSNNSFSSSNNKNINNNENNLLGNASYTKTPLNTSINQNNEQTITKIIRDPDTNEILSIKRVNSNISKTSNQKPIQLKKNEDEKEKNNDLDHSNISVIDVPYPTDKISQNIQSKTQTNETDEGLDLPQLPPPLPFQKQTLSDEANHSRRSSTIKNNYYIKTNDGDNINNTTRSTPLEKQNTNNNEEDFHSTHEINLNLSHFDVNQHSDRQVEDRFINDELENEKQEESFLTKSKNLLNNSKKTSNFFDEIKSFDSSKLKPIKGQDIPNGSNVIESQTSFQFPPPPPPPLPPIP